MSIFPQKAKEIIVNPIPDQLIKQRPGGGGKSLSYLSGSTIVDILNQSFDYLWDWETEKEWIQESQPKYNPKFDKEPTPQGPVAHVKGKLTVHLSQGDGTFLKISKTGYGSKAVLGAQADQESVFKAAGTDAIKKAASLFGIGLELYRDEIEQQYFEELNYENPWTDELLEKHSKERDYIKEVVSDYELSDKDLDELVHEFNENLAGIGDITPDNIGAFASYLELKTSKTETAEAS